MIKATTWSVCFISCMTLSSVARNVETEIVGVTVGIDVGDTVGTDVGELVVATVGTVVARSVVVCSIVVC